MPEEKNAAVVADALVQNTAQKDAAQQDLARKHAGEAAFFDVDNTLMKGASLFHVARKMYERKAFTLSQAAGFA